MDLDQTMQTDLSVNYRLYTQPLVSSALLQWISHL